MAPRKNYKNDTFSRLRNNDGTESADMFSTDNAESLAKLLTACLSNGASFYGRKNRDNSITIRIYDGDDKYEEVLGHTEDWDIACEEMIEALWGIAAVTVARKRMPARSAQRAQELRKMGELPANTKTHTNGAEKAS